MSERAAWCEPVHESHATTLRVEVVPPAPAPPSPAMQEAWRRMTGSNPRLFDGPILAFADADLARGVVRAQPSSYMVHATGEATQTGARLLSVTGVLLMRVGDERDRVHLGRRSPHSHTYPGQWELGPSGGLAPPTSGNSLSFKDILAELSREIHEELGTSLTFIDACAVALCHDSVARSVDIVILTRVMTPPDPIPVADDRWEYQDTVWVSIENLPAFLDSNHAIEPTRAIAKHLGWV